MSVEQAKSFAEGLKAILEQNQQDRKSRTDDYADKLNEIGESVAEEVKEFQAESHDYAKDMVSLNDQLNKDIQELYQSIYTEEDEGHQEA